MDELKTERMAKLSPVYSADFASWSHLAPSIKTYHISDTYSFSATRRPPLQIGLTTLSSRSAVIPSLCYTKAFSPHMGLVSSSINGCFCPTKYKSNP